MDSKIFVYFFKTFKLILFFSLAILIIRTFIVEPGRVSGRSMELKYFDGNFFLINKFILLLREPKKGEIVQFYNEEENKYLIKRVIGLPGESVIIKKNSVFILKNGLETKLSEPYLKENIATETPTGEAANYQAIPPDSYFVMGDNRPESIDSREMGPINRSYITGLVID